MIIDGINFDNLEGFYDEIEVNLTDGLDFRIGRNLNAFNDILREGFGVHEYEEPLRIIWLNIDKSEKDLKLTINSGCSLKSSKNILISILFKDDQAIFAVPTLYIQKSQLSIQN